MKFVFYLISNHIFVCINHKDISCHDKSLAREKKVSIVVDKLYIDGRLYQEELDKGKPEGATGPRAVEVNSDSKDGAGNRIEITRGVR